MIYLYGAFVFCTLAIVWAAFGVVRHIRRHNAEMPLRTEAQDSPINPPTE